MIKHYYLISTKYIKLFFFNIDRLTVIKNGKKLNILYMYLLFKFFDNLISMMNYTNEKLLSMRDVFLIDFEKIQITKIDFESEKTIILDNSFRRDSNNLINFKNLKNYLDNINFIKKDTMLDCIIVNFDLVTDSKKICLKELIVKYNDRCEIYNHTLNNILTFDDIVFNSESKINIKMFIKDGKKFVVEHLLEDVKNKHLNYFLLRAKQ